MYLHAVDQKAPVTTPLAGDEEGVDAAGRYLVDPVVLAVVEAGGAALVAPDPLACVFHNPIYELGIGIRDQR